MCEPYSAHHHIDCSLSSVTCSYRAQIPRRYSSNYAPARASYDMSLPASQQLRARSKKGCWTCRQRKVKCDETQPLCAPCARLGRQCVWGQTWTFHDLSYRIRQRHKHVSTLGCWVWTQGPHCRNLTQPSHIRHRILVSPFIELSDDDKREEKALTQPPGTFNVILTPDSFFAVSGCSDRSRQLSALPAASSTALYQNDPNLLFLDKFEESPYLPILQHHTSQTVTFTTEQHDICHTWRSISGHGRAFHDKIMRHYKSTVLVELLPPTLLPLHVVAKEDVILRESRIFTPVGQLKLESTIRSC